MQVASSVLELIGHTPLLHLSRIVEHGGARVLAKCEYLNPTGSLKDRTLLAMIEDAEREGTIRPGETVLIEATSGNTGISLAALGSLKGYAVVIVMVEDTNPEIVDLIGHFGAKVVLTPSSGFSPEDLIVDGKPVGSEKAARRLRNRITAEMLAADPRKHMLNQFANPANVRAHRQTGVEIIEQTDGKVDALVMGVGTGGSMMGIVAALREVQPGVRVVAVEPAEACPGSGWKHTIFGIQGISDGVLPAIFDPGNVDEIVCVRSADAWHTASRLAQTEGLLVGPSSGANVNAALQVAAQMREDQVVVTILADQAGRYLSFGLFAQD